MNGVSASYVTCMVYACIHNEQYLNGLVRVNTAYGLGVVCIDRHQAPISMAPISALHREELELIFNALHRKDRVAASLASRLFNELRPERDRFRVCLRCARLHQFPQWPVGLCLADLTDPHHERRIHAIELLASLDFDALDPMLIAVHAGAIRRAADNARLRIHSAAQLLSARLRLHCIPEVRMAAAKAIANMRAEDLDRCTEVPLAWKERRAMHLVGMRDIGALDPVVLVQYAGTVARKLDDVDRDVRRVAMETLGKLEPAEIAQYAGAVVRKLEDDDWYVRRAASWVLGKLEPAALAQHAVHVAQKLRHAEWHVRLVSMKMLGELQPATIAIHARVVTQMLTDDNSEVRHAAVQTLGRLVPAELAKHTDAVTRYGM